MCSGEQILPPDIRIIENYSVWCLQFIFSSLLRTHLVTSLSETLKEERKYWPILFLVFCSIMARLREVNINA